MTLRETITEGLLNYVDNPDGLDEVFRKYSKSKGPFYLGLADATSELIDRYETLAHENGDLDTHKNDLSDQVAALDDQEAELQESVQMLGNEVQTAEQRLREAQSSLDHLDSLARSGFGGHELARLSDLLAQVSAEQGGAPEEGVLQFFQTVERFESIISFDLEATRAETKAAQSKAESERWGAEVEAKEVQSKTRIAVIDLVGDLLKRGVKGDDFITWSSIIDTAGVTVGDLAGSLEAYSNIQSLSDDLRARSEVLQAEVLGLESQVDALRKERYVSHEAIVAVKDKALKEVKAAERQAKKYVDSLVRDAVNYGDLKKQAAELSDWINAARYLRDGNTENWRSLPPELIEHLLLGVIVWAQQQGRDIPVRAPGVVLRVNRLLEYMPLKFSQVLMSALAGINAADEQKSVQEAHV